MILKITFNDNDYQNILEKIGNNMFSMYSYFRTNRLAKKEDANSIKDYVEITKIMDELLKMIQDEVKFTETQKKLFIREIKKSILAYLEDTLDKDEYNYLSKSLKLSIINSLRDHWDNGEVLYYFPMHDTYIIM